MEDCVVAGGTEMMSYTATLTGGGLMDAGNMTLQDLQPQWHQGICADLIATLEGISREDVDGLAYPKPAACQGSHRRVCFARSMVPVHNETARLALDPRNSPDRKPP